MQRPFQIRALGEIAVRCRSLADMVRFYEDVLGLEPLEDGHREGIVFFRIAEGYRGHTTVLALFQGEPGDCADASSLHHFALGVDYGSQAAAARYFDQLGVAWRFEEFAWIGWRGLFVTDPEGNTVELVAATGKGRSGSVG